MTSASRWFLEGEKKRKKMERKNPERALPQYKAVGKSVVRNSPSKPSYNFFESLESLFDSFKHAKMPDSSRLNRGNKRIGNYNGKDFSDDIVNFFKGNAKQIGGSYSSTVGTIRNKVGGADMQDHAKASYDELMNAIKNGKSYDGTVVKKKAEAQTRKVNQGMINTADNLLESGAKDIEKTKEGKNGFEKFVIDASSAGTQMATDFLVGGGTGKLAKLGAKGINRATNLAMGVRASGSAMNEARKSGATENEQIAYGLLSGGVEVATEKLGNIAKPFKAMYGKGVTDDVVEKMARGAATKFAKTNTGKELAYNLTKLGITATEEGAEEMISEIVSPALKNMTYSKDEKVDWGDVLYSGAIGATLGGIGGGAGQAIDHSRNKSYVKDSGLDEADNFGALLNEGLASDETTPANRIAKQLKNNVESGGEASAREIVSLQQANQEAIEAENYAYEQQSDLARKAADRQGLAPIMIENDSGDAVVGGATSQRLKETTGRVAEKLLATQTVDDGAAMDKAASISRIMVGMGDGGDFSMLLPTVENEPARQVYMEETGSVLPDTNEGTRATLSQSNMTNMLMMRQEETKYQNQQQKAAIVQEAQASLGEEGAAVFSNLMQHTDGSYDVAMKEFKNYYDGGIVNYPAAQIDSTLGRGALSYPMKMAAWNAGYKDSESRKQANDVKMDKVSTGKKKSPKGKRGTFKSYVAPAVVAKEKQEGLKRLARALNVNIQLDPVLEHDANGYYKDGTIHLSAKTDNPMLSVFKHELTHHIQETAPESYQKLKDFVMQEYYKGDQKAFRAAIDEKVQAYAKQGEKLTRDQAIDEIIANSTEKFLTDEAAIEKVVKQDRTLGQAILDAIKKMIQSIKSLLTEANDVDKGYSKFMEDLGILEKAEKLWVDALKASVENETSVNGSVIKYSRKTQKKDIVSIKEQIKQNIQELNEMEPVSKIESKGFKGKTDKQILDDVVGEYKKYGMGVDRQDFGFISLEETLVNNSLNYLSTEAEYAAFSTIPKVLKRGMEIQDKEHKGRGHNTVTFAAPVVINGRIGIVGVVVKKTKGNRYKTHRIVMPDGSAYVFEHNKTEATTDGMTDTKNGEGPTITSVSKNSISNSIKKNKKQFSLKDHPDEQALIDYVNAGIETKFIDMPLVRDYERKAKTVRMKSVEELTRQVEQLREETKLTHGKMPDQRDLINQSNNLVRTLLGGKRTNHKLVDLCAKNAGQMFTAIKRGHEEDAIIQAYNTARELIENLDLVDDTMYLEYKSLRDYLRQTPIKVAEQDRSVDYEDFRRSQIGRLKLTSKDGLPVDTIYEELKELYPALFSEDITNPADQLQEIADVRESLDPYDVLLTNEETEQLIKEAASSLLEIAYNGRPKRTFADKQKAFYNSKVKRLKEQQKESKEKVRKQYQSIVKKHDEKARQRRIEDKQKARNKVDKKKFVETITKNFNWLSDRLIKPTDAKHLPDGFEKAVAELLQCFDLQTERSKALEVKFGKSKKTLNFENLMRQYGKIAKEDGGGEIEYDGYVFEMMDALAEKLQGKTIDQASNADLKQMDTLLKAIVGNFRNINKAFSANIKETISDLGDTAVAEFQAKSAKRKGKGHSENIVDRVLNESMVTPGDFFEIVGGGMDSMYKNIRKGLDAHVSNIDHTRKFFEEIFQKYNNKKKPGSKIQSWSDAPSQQEFKLQQGGTIKMNPAQVMSFYCLNKREQAQGHIYASGIVASEVTAGRKIAQKLRGERSNTSKTSYITQQDAEKILSTLTPEQIEIADKLMEYLNTTCAEWGNETSLRMNNYKKFNEENYFPIISAKEYLDADFSKRTSNMVETIKNASFTKNTIINANNPIMIADIFEVVTDHINKMSMYNALAAPISDFQRVFNYKQRDEMGFQRTSVQVEMREAFGNKALDYIQNLMSDLNNFGNTRKDPIEALLNKSLAAYKKAAIGFNLRVAIQQPTAIARAFAHISPRYFVNGKINMRQNLKEMKEYCPIALWKSWGFSQTDVARDMKDIIMNDNWTKLDLVSMKPYGALDNATWATIWAAVKAETESKHKEIEIGSDEYWKICADRAAYIFDRTQVVDSPLHRSQVMRSQNVGMKMITSFMAEPTRTFNMCRTELFKGMAEIQDGKKAAGMGRIGKVTTVFIFNAALVSAAAAVVDAMREKVPGGGGDDDEEKSRAEYWLMNFWANLGDNMNPINMIPGLKDVWNMKDGWGTSNMALEGAEKMVMAVVNWNKFIQGESKKTPAELMRKSAEAIGMVTGVPVKNMIREFESWTKLVGIEVHAATKGDEKPESEKNFFDKFRDWLGKSQKDDKGDKDGEKKEKSFDEKLSDIKEATEGLSGDEKQDVIWRKATKGYTKHIEDGDLTGVAEIRKLLEECGGDVDTFDEKVLKGVKTGFKKSVGTDDMKVAEYRDYLEEAGYTDGKISQELVCKSDTAKAFQEAGCFNDEDKMVDTCAALIMAGGQKADIYALYENRSKAISAVDYSTGEFQFPTDGRISSGFGHRSSPGGIGSTDHKGVDIAAAAGSDVNVADGGKVEFVGYNSSRGAYVRVSHGSGRTTLYQHLNDYIVQKGDVVQKGQVIAHVGSTGNSTGPHLHFEVKQNGSYINPMMYF